VFPQGSQISMTITFTDKEGDIEDTLWMQRRSYVCPDIRSDSGLGYPLPDFPKGHNLKSDFLISFNYGVTTPPTINGCPNFDDSTYFRFWLKDHAGHTSDTLVSPTIVLLHQ